MEKRVIWITGASSGIGEALAKQYALNKNTALILSSRRKSELERVAAQCKSRTEVAILPLDLEKTEEAEQYVQKAISFFGHINLLINNGQQENCNSCTRIAASIFYSYPKYTTRCLFSLLPSDNVLFRTYFLAAFLNPQ